jgi:hypothetical protein
MPKITEHIPPKDTELQGSFLEPQRLWWRVDLTHSRHWRRVGSRAVVKRTGDGGDLQWLPPLFTFLACGDKHRNLQKETQQAVGLNFLLPFQICSRVCLDLLHCRSVSFGRLLLLLCSMYCAVRRNRRESGVATGGDELGLLACGSLATLRWRHRRWGVAVVDSGSQSPKAVGGSVFF